MIKDKTRKAIRKAADALYELNADPVLRKLIRQREKARNDYNNNLSIVRSEGIKEGRLEERQRMIENMRKAGFSEEQIQSALGAILKEKDEKMKDNFKKKMEISDEDKLWLALANVNSEAALKVYKSRIQDPEVQKVLDTMYELNQDPFMSEKIRQHEMAIFDYYNDMSVARREGKEEGISQERQRVEENMRINGFSEEQIQLALESISR